MDPAILPAPIEPMLGRAGPAGQLWAVHDPGHNVFIERSGFWFTLKHVNTWFATDLYADTSMTLPAWLWAAGCADLNCNGVHIARNDCPRYMYPKRQRVEIPLVAGANHLAVRLQVLGLRDSRYLFGLQCANPGTPAVIRRPGELHASVEAQQAGNQVARPPATVAMLLAAGGPADKADPTPRGSGRDHDSRRLSHMRAAMELGVDTAEVQAVVCARSIGVYRDSDRDVLAKTCQWIDGRPDCADFALAAVLRLAALNLVDEAERNLIKQTVIRFRYWTDEAGDDAMCFTSENHRLLFHSGQLIAGRLWPDERFNASGRSGRQQAEIGLQRCRQWLDAAEAHGFREYNSSGYIPITAAALMNVVDCSGNPEASRRAVALVDGIFRRLADQTFCGVVISPQGRVYRQVLEPETSGTQALLSYAVHDAVISHSVWLGYLASLPTYQPPDDLAARMVRPISCRYRQHTTEIVLHKTAEYILTSVAVGEAQPPAEDPSEDHERKLAAGQAGYQQHLWYASLGKRGHVFVNHPGEWIDLGSARPGYWYGNGILPRTEQRDNLLMQIYEIHDDHPVPFVHAYWPADMFDETAVENRWRVARRGRGYVGLWCSVPLEAHDQVLVGQELRAWSQRSAWVCVCSSASEHPNLAAFLAHCQALAPRYDQSESLLLLADGTKMGWLR